MGKKPREYIYAHSWTDVQVPESTTSTKISILIKFTVDIIMTKKNNYNAQMLISLVMFFITDH